MGRNAEVGALLIKSAVSLAQGWTFCVAVRFFHGVPAETGKPVLSMWMVAMTTFFCLDRQDDEVEVED